MRGPILYLALITAALAALSGCAAAQLNRQVVELHHQGRYEEALPLAREALDIRENKLGPDHPGVAYALNNLALLHEALGDYQAAQPLYQRALDIYRQTYGPEHKYVATALNNLAALYYFLGNYRQAEEFYKESLAIRLRVHGPQSLAAAQSYNNLAELYRTLGNLTTALVMHEKALSILEKVKGPDHPEVAVSLSNLAILHDRLGDRKTARRFIERALAIDRQTLGPGHPYLATDLNILGLLHYADGQYGSALPHLEEAQAIQIAAFGESHPAVAQTRHNLSAVHQALGNLEKAEELQLKALATKKDVFGPNHPTVALSLTRLGLLRAAGHQPEAAHQLFKQAEEIDYLLLDQVIGFATADQKLKFLSLMSSSIDLPLNLVNQYLADQPSARRDAFDLWLNRKGLILESQRQYQQTLLGTDSPQALDTFRTLAEVRSRLARLVLAGPGDLPPQSYQTALLQLQIQKEKLETVLGRLSQAYARLQQDRRTDTMLLVEKLPPKSALVEFARIQTFDFSKGDPNQGWQDHHYLALVLNPARNATPALLDLGPAAKIDRLVSALKKQITDLKQLTGPRIKNLASQLHDLVFAPLLPALAGQKDLFLSPDGHLSLIPFEVLVDRQGRYLVDSYTFNYLTAGRDLANFERMGSPHGSDLIIGAPDFGLPIQTEQPGPDGEASQSRPPAMATPLYFTPLPGTAEEALAVRDILGPSRTRLITGTSATEEMLKTAETPGILHLATHGFFLPDRTSAPIATVTDSSSRSTLGYALMSPSQLAGLLGEPLLRSGLALAGANRATSTPGTNDGLLTAEEALGLKLDGTELVVLSACQTGEGEVENGEGVYGLRRAFTQAGARGLVMSMWVVPDRETLELMMEFYKNLQSGRFNRAQALRQAMLKQKTVTRQRYGHTNPLFWGSFVFLGRP
jgi:CHAT domain-containing protein/Tfp pilus assembly protein PilF